MKLIPKVSKEAKQTLMGGLVASLAVNLESGLSWFVPAYPQILKDKIIPQLPRNGALVANLAPVGVSYYLKKKGRTSAKMENITTGVMLYDLPKFMSQVIYNVAYGMGTPQARFGAMAMNRAPMQLKLNVRPAMTNGIGAKSFGYPQTAGTAGKYALKTSSPKASMGGGIGKYR